MNKWFDKIEYGKYLVNTELPRYSDNDAYMMAGYLIWSGGLSQKEALDVIWNKFEIAYTHSTLIARQKRVVTAVCKAFEKAYGDVTPLSVYQQELDVIATISSAIQRRVMFTLLCFAKYNRQINPENDGWVNFDDTMIRKSSGVSVSSAEYNDMLYQLKERGLITNSKRITSNNMKVNCLQDSGDTVYRINDLRGLGDVYVYNWGQYLPADNNHRAFRGVLRQCSKCGSPFLDKSSHHNRLKCSCCR